MSLLRRRDRTSGAFLHSEPVQHLRAPPRPQHYYEMLDESAGPDLFIPAIWAAKEPPRFGVRRGDRLWQQDKSMRWNLDNLMDIIAGMLHISCGGFYNGLLHKWTYFQPLRNAFQQPSAGCMRLQRERVAKTKHAYMHPTRKYVQLTLFREERRQVRVGAHHFILWAVHGIPPSQLHSQAMHTCARQEDPCCVSPNHVKWATPSENARDFRRRTRRR